MAKRPAKKPVAKAHVREPATQALDTEASPEPTALASKASVRYVSVEQLIGPQHLWEARRNKLMRTGNLALYQERARELDVAADQDLEPTTLPVAVKTWLGYFLVGNPDVVLAASLLDIERLPCIITTVDHQDEVLATLNAAAGERSRAKEDPDEYYSDPDEDVPAYMAR
jgi:hypothetical protein